MGQLYHPSGVIIENIIQYGIIKLVGAKYFSPDNATNNVNGPEYFLPDNYITKDTKEAVPKGQPLYLMNTFQFSALQGKWILFFCLLQFSVV